MKRFIPIILLLVFIIVVWNLFRDKRRASDSDFVMVENTLSPSGENRILVYHYDHGAIGDSRAWYSITPPNYQSLNLVNYELPNCYEAEKWLEANVLLISKREPCQYKEKHDELKTDDIFKGVKVRVVLKTDFLCEQGLEEGTTIPPSR